jgi:TonB family protein
LKSCRPRFKTFLGIRLTVVALFTAYLSVPSRTPAQQADLNSLVAPIAQEISKGHERKIAVLPLISRDQENASVGIWLAKQIAVNLANSVPRIELLDANSVAIPVLASKDSRHPSYDQKAVEAFAKHSGAKVIVQGSFGAFEEGLGVSLTASKKGRQEILTENAGKLNLTSEITALLVRPLKSDLPSDGVYEGGWAGVGLPKCLKCPDPGFPVDARSSHTEGRVILFVLVGLDGASHQIEVKEATSPSFARQAINAVNTWKFEPALGPNREPVPVRVPVEISFRFRP